jgi:hypothetical protein
MDKPKLFKVAQDSTKAELFDLYCEQMNLVEKLQEGLNEALDWNWLDEDHPKDVMERLLNLVSI